MDQAPVLNNPFSGLFLDREFQETVRKGFSSSIPELPTDSILNSAEYRDYLPEVERPLDIYDIERQPPLEQDLNLIELESARVVSRYAPVPDPKLSRETPPSINEVKNDIMDSMIRAGNLDVSFETFQGWVREDHKEISSMYEKADAPKLIWNLDQEGVLALIQEKDPELFEMYCALSSDEGYPKDNRMVFSPEEV